MELIVLYVFQHLFSPLLLVRQLSFWYLLLSILVVVFIHFVKPDTYDIASYTQAMDYPFSFEIGYALLSFFSKLVLQDNRVALYLVQVILTLLFLSLSFQVENKYQKMNNLVTYSVIITSSVAFYLGVNNAIRQGFSSILLMWCFYFFSKKKLLRSFLFLLLAQGFHNSSILFYSFFIIVYTCSILRQDSIHVFNLFKLRIHKTFSTDFIKIILIPFILILSIFTLYYLIFQIGFFMSYGDMILTIDRTPAYLKILPIIAIFAITEFYLGKYKHTSKADFFNILRLLRWSLVLLMLFLLHNRGFDELISRILYFFMCIDCTILVHAWNTKKHRKVVVFTLLSYAFATNVWNIISRGG